MEANNIQSTLFLEIVWRRQATNHYLIPCWLIHFSPYSDTGCIESIAAYVCMSYSYQTCKIWWGRSLITHEYMNVKYNWCTKWRWMIEIFCVGDVPLWSRLRPAVGNRLVNELMGRCRCQGMSHPTLTPVDMLEWCWPMHYLYTYGYIFYKLLTISMLSIQYGQWILYCHGYSTMCFRI